MLHSFFSFRLCGGLLFAALLGSLVLSGCDSLSVKEEDDAASSIAQPVALPGQRALISQHCNCDSQRETGSDPQPLTFWLANTAGITGYYLSTSATLPSNPTWSSTVPDASFGGTQQVATTFYGWVKDGFGNAWYWGAVTLLLDQSAPSLSAVSLSTNNAFVAGPATPAYAITGNTVTLTITASESLRTLSATIGGKTATVSGSGASWTATVAMTASDNESSSLPITIDFTDLAGNAGTQVTATTDSSTVMHDNTAPTSPFAKITSPASSPTNSRALTLSLSASESDSADSQINAYQITETATAPSATGASWTSVTPTTSYSNSSGSHTLTSSGDGNKFIYAWFRDGAGNVSSAGSDNITVDETAPTLSISAPSKTTAGTSDNITYTVTYTGADTITLANGDLTVNSTDNATGTATVSGSGTDNRTVTFTSLSGIGTLGFSIAAGTATDTAGNSAAAAGPSDNFTMDGTAPTVSISYAPNPSDPDNVTGPYKLGDNVTLTLTFSEAVQHASPSVGAVAHAGQYTATDNVTCTPNCTTASVIHTVQSGDGTQTVTVTGMEDLAGNALTTTPTSGDNYTIDNTFPTISSLKLDNGTAIKSDNSSDNISTKTGGFEITFSEALKASTVSVNGGSSGSAKVSCDSSYSLRLGADNTTTSGQTKCREIATATTTDNTTWTLTLRAIGNAECPIHDNGTGSCPSTLEPSQGYEFLAAKSITDWAGNALDNGSDNRTSFLTRKAPTVDNITPSSGLSDASLGTAAVFHFDSKMNPSTFVDGSTVTVSCSPSPTSPQNCNFYSYYDNVTDNLTVYPLSPWPESTTVTVTVKGKTGSFPYSGVYEAVEGIFLASDNATSFTTRGPLSTGLVAHYTLDGNALDHSTVDGSFQDGTLPGGTADPTATTGRDNETNGSYSFDGDDYLGVAHHANLNMTSFTAAAWLNLTAIGNYREVVASKASGNDGYEFGVNNGELTMWVYTGSGQTATSTTCGLTASQWHHAVWTWQSGEQRFYANGTLCGSDTDSGTITYTSNKLAIGGDWNGANPTTDQIKGSIDDLKLFSRVLSADEVFDLYFEEGRRLYAYYPLAGNANDHSGNSRDGTMVGTLTSDGGRTNQSGKGLYFTGGTGDYVSLPSGFDDFTDGLTITAWSYPTADTLSTNRNWARVVDFGNGAPDSNVILAKWATSTGLAYHTYQDTSSSNRDELEQSDYFQSGRWNFEAVTHAAGTAGSLTTGTLFRNGAAVKSETVKMPPVVTRTNNYIGESNWSSDSTWQGSHDDIRVYQRALTAAEISAVYRVADQHPPTPGNSGVVTVTNPGTTTPTLNWTAATDDYSDNSSLQYQVVRYTANNRINNPETAQRNGTAQACTSSWTASLTSCTVDTQSSGTDYYYTVLVRDGDGNVGAYNPVPVFDMLLAYYPFNGDINDYSGNSRNLVAKDDDSAASAATFRANNTGAASQALDLAGRATGSDPEPSYFEYEFPSGSLGGSYTTVTYLGDGQTYTRINNYTISYWAAADSNSQQSNSAMFATVSNTDLGFQFALLDTDSDGTSDFMVKYEDLSIDPQSGSQSGDIAETNVKYDDVTVGQWSHVTVTYDGTNMIVYGNGVLKQTISGGVTAFDRFKVGANRNGDKYFDGGFDELRIYGQALSAEEVAILYNSETSN